QHDDRVTADPAGGIAHRAHGGVVGGQERGDGGVRAQPRQAECGEGGEQQGHQDGGGQPGAGARRSEVRRAGGGEGGRQQGHQDGGRQPGARSGRLGGRQGGAGAKGDWHRAGLLFGRG